MSDHPKYGHLSRCSSDPNKLCRVSRDQVEEAPDFIGMTIQLASYKLKLEAIYGMWSEMPKAYMVKYNNDIGIFDSESYNEDIQAWREAWMALMDE